MEPQGEQAQYEVDREEEAEWERDRQQRANAGGSPEPQQVVQVRLPGAARTYAYAVPAHWAPLKAGDWVRVPSNQVSPDGGKGRVESFGRDGYTGPLKALTDRLEPQDPWLVRMEAVRGRSEANTVWKAAKDAGVAPERLRGLLAAGKTRLETVDAKRERLAAYREQRREGEWG